MMNVFLRKKRARKIIEVYIEGKERHSNFVFLTTSFVSFILLVSGIALLSLGIAYSQYYKLLAGIALLLLSLVIFLGGFACYYFNRKNIEEEHQELLEKLEHRQLTIDDLEDLEDEISDVTTYY